MNLLELQRRMEEDVRRPLTAEYAMQPATGDGTSMEQIAASYIAPNPQLTSFERLEIYNRQYWFRVIGSVSEDFPALEAVLGPQRFRALVLDYLKNNPSTSWTLRELGAKLPAFLEVNPPHAGRRHRLAVDVAHLEWAYIDAFDSRQLTPLSSEDLQAIGPDSQLSVQPHLSLLALQYPVDELVLAVHQATPESEAVSSAASERGPGTLKKLPAMRRARVYLAVHRFEDSVYYRRIGREAYLLLQAMRTGASISEALQASARGSSLNKQQQAAAVQECFAHASELGWLCPRREDEHDQPLPIH